jgi:anti-sigma B factor antagonist
MPLRPVPLHPSDDWQGTAPLSVDVSPQDADSVVVTPAGEADLYTVPRLRHALRQAIAMGRSRVIVDLDQLIFMDASTLGVLVDARRRMSEAGGSLQVRCHTRQGRRVLSVAGLDGLLQSDA